MPARPCQSPNEVIRLGKFLRENFPEEVKANKEKPEMDAISAVSCAIDILSNLATSLKSHPEEAGMPAPIPQGGEFSNIQWLIDLGRQEKQPHQLLLDRAQAELIELRRAPALEDPRAHLRKARFVPDGSTIYFHMHFIDSNHEAMSMIELEGGVIKIVPATWVEFKKGI